MYRFNGFLVFMAVFICSVAGFSTFPQSIYAGYFDYDDVLVVINDNSATSTTIGNYFVASRGIASTSVIHINTVTSESVTRTEFTNNIRTPIENFITSKGITTTTNYIVTTKGVPLRLSDTTNSLEAELGLILGPHSGKIGTFSQAVNPYKDKKEKFSRETYGIYLVTRLDGYTIPDVLGMIDRSANSTTTNIGTFVLDVAPVKDGGTYQVGNDWMRNATTSLINRGYNVVLDQTNLFLTNQTDLLGYYSWGSNDNHANLYTTNAIPYNTYKNGSIAETIVSTSARSFTVGTTYGQSLIADLIAEGVSGVKGYVAEPFLGAIAHADVLFDRYTAGYNMADSFFAATAQINWKDVVIGDPKMVIAKSPLPFDISLPANNVISGSQSPTFTWGGTDGYYGITKYQLFIDGVLNRDNILGTSTTPLTDISPGLHSWYIKAVDSQGNTSTSTSSFVVNIVPGYTSGYTFYVDNVLGNNNNPGTAALPWATLAKAGSTVLAGDEVVVIKNNGVPYRETLLPTHVGTATATITFRGVDLNSKPEIWGSDDVSSGWSAYGGGAPDTYQRALTINPKVVAVGPSISNLVKKIKGVSTTLNPGEWYWVSNVLYYRLTGGESIGSLHIEASARNYGIQLPNYTAGQDFIVQYANNSGINLSGASSLAQRIEVYNSALGLIHSGNGARVSRSIFANNVEHGFYGSFAINATLDNSIFYGNNGGGGYIWTLFTTSMALQNNIFATNGTSSVSFNEIAPPLLISASNNLWDVSGDSKWNTYKGTSNQELTDPLLVAPSSNNFQLQELSPAIDNGTNTSATTDIIGNPIYGTPDIGPYEYQPPYTIGSNDIDMTGNVRLYADGKYRYTTTHSGGTSAKLAVSPVGGFGTGNYSEFMDISISKWNTSGDYQKAWTESSVTATSTLHTIGDMNPNNLYDVVIDGATTSPYTQVRADSAGKLSFTYDGGYSTHTFELIKNDYGCINSSATNYDYTATLDDGSCVYNSGGGGGGSSSGGQKTTPTKSVPATVASSSTVLNSSATPSSAVDQPVIQSKLRSPITLTRTLSFGMTGTDVTTLQTFLAQDPSIYPEGIISGYFGRLTELAVQRYQQQHNIASSGTPETTGFGLVGPMTRRVMGEGAVYPSVVPSTTPAPVGTTTKSRITLTRTLSFGMTGTDVTTLQTFLAQDPSIYPEGIISGYFGRLTELAVQRYQQQHNIASSGTPETTGFGLVGPRTREVMGGL